MNEKTMKAIVCNQYGAPDVLEYIDIKKPKPKDNEVLVKIICASVSSGDARMRSLDTPMGTKFIFRLIMGFNKPRAKILGSQFSGIVEAVGKDTLKFNIGDEVYGITGMKFGCYAEYICIKENAVIAKKPANITFEQAVPIPFGAMTALHILQNGGIKQYDRILIYGASGSVGTYAVQIAKYMGAKVSAMCSPRNFSLIKSLGADEVLDYRSGQSEIENTQYDFIFDAVGKITKKKFKSLLKPTGKYLSVKDITTETIKKLDYLNEMIKEEKLYTVIDKVYSLVEIQDAHKYVDTGHKTGNIVIRNSH